MFRQPFELTVPASTRADVEHRVRWAIDHRVSGDVRLKLKHPGLIAKVLPRGIRAWGSTTLRATITEFPAPAPATTFVTDARPALLTPTHVVISGSVTPAVLEYVACAVVGAVAIPCAVLGFATGEALIALLSCIPLLFVIMWAVMTPRQVRQGARRLRGRIWTVTRPLEGWPIEAGAPDAGPDARRRRAG